MPFFLFADTVFVGTAIMVWLTLEGFILVPTKDGAMGALLGIHGLLVLTAVYKRNKVEFTWFGMRHLAWAVALTCALLALAHLYLFFPQLASLRLGQSVATATLTPSDELWRLGWGGNLFLLACWILGGCGAAALCFGLLCLELERSGSRQMAVYIGASGYALLFLGQSIFYLKQGSGEDIAHILRAIVIMMDRWLIAFAAGYLFITTRHLLMAGLLLGGHEWIVRYALNEARNAMFEPLVVLHAESQKLYWIVRLAAATAALLMSVAAYRRWGVAGGVRPPGMPDATPVPVRDYET